MKTSKWYLILIILDAILVIMWPILAIATPYPAWLAFCAGAVWCSDVYDIARHYNKYRAYKKMGE